MCRYKKLITQLQKLINWYEFKCVLVFLPLIISDIIWIFLGDDFY